MNVLILEDNKRCREALEGIVESCQNVSRVFCFARREEAFICAADYKIDLFLIDIILETGKDNDNSGIKFADSLRECASYKLTPIIFITALAGLERELLKRVHCYDYIEKPIGDGQLIKAHINEALEAVALGMKPEKREYIPLRHDGIGYMVFADEIVYFQNRRGILYIHTIDDIITIPGLSSKKFMKKIKRTKFLIPTYGTGVNANYISSIDFRNKEVYLKNSESIIPIGGRKFKQFKEEYLNWQS